MAFEYTIEVNNLHNSDTDVINHVSVTVRNPSYDTARSKILTIVGKVFSKKTKLNFTVFRGGRNSRDEYSVYSMSEFKRETLPTSEIALREVEKVVSY